MVIYKRFQLLGFDWENFGVLDWLLFIGGGRLRDQGGGRTWRFDCTVKQSFVPESVWSHKCPNIFNFGLVFIFTGTQWFWTGTHDFSQDESKDSC